MGKLRLCLSILLMIVLVTSAVIAQESDPKAREIAWKAYEASYFRGEDVKSRARMKITDSEDRVRTRKLSILRKNMDDHRQKYYSYFHEPADLRRMVFMVWTHPGKDDDRWLYLPSIDLIQRITGSQKRNSFAGSNFTYEDMTGRYPGNDHFQYKGTEIVDGDTVHVLKGIPKKPDMVEFSFYRAYVDAETFLPKKSVFFTPQGEPHRTLTLEKTREIEGILTPVVQKAVNHQTGSRTVTTMSETDYNIGVPERIFEQRYLRRPPTPYIQP